MLFFFISSYSTRPKFIIKLLHSVISNIKNTENIDVSQLVIKTIYVDQGPMLKRSVWFVLSY